MKNQYFGDVNDYLKYSLLRAVASHLPGRLVVCWMLTPDDGRSDGNLTRYLTQPDRFRDIDPPLFDQLRVAIEKGRRDVKIVECEGLIGNASYLSSVLEDSRESRTAYFRDLAELAT